MSNISIILFGGSNNSKIKIQKMSYVKQEMVDGFLLTQGYL